MSSEQPGEASSSGDPGKASSSKNQGQPSSAEKPLKPRKRHSDTKCSWDDPIIKFHTKDHEGYHNKVKGTTAEFENEEPVFVMSEIDRLRVRNLEFQPIHVPERKRVTHTSYIAADLIRFPPGPDGPDGDEHG